MKSHIVIDGNAFYEVERTASVFKRNISGESSRIRICAQRG